MALITRAQAEARKLLTEIGMDDIAELPMDLLASGLDATLIEKPMTSCDGRITFGVNRALIRINSLIEFPERKRFIAAHEIGHLRMHRGMDLPPDTKLTLNIISGMEKQLKTGKQELEANQFAAELLMPAPLFKNIAFRKPFSPELLKELAQRFRTSLTATAFRYAEMNLHPICIVMTAGGLVKYFRKSEEMKVYLGDITKVPPPAGSVAREYIESGYEFLYSKHEKAQVIKKSVWFDIGRYGDDSDYYEYCIPTKAYKTVLSIIWEK